MSEKKKPRRGQSASKKEKPKREPFEFVIEFPDVPLETPDPSNPTAEGSASPKKRGTQRLTFRLGGDS